MVGDVWMTLGEVERQCSGVGSLSAMWVLDIELRSPCLVAGTFTCQAISSPPPIQHLVLISWFSSVVDLDRFVIPLGVTKPASTRSGHPGQRLGVGLFGVSRVISLRSLQGSTRSLVIFLCSLVL